MLQLIRGMNGRTLLTGAVTEYTSCQLCHEIRLMAVRKSGEKKLDKHFVMSTRKTKCCLSEQIFFKPVACNFTHDM
jgi:hypothetical protein